MNFKKFKKYAADSLVAECQKVAPELGKQELFWVCIAAACTGWLLVGLCTSPQTLSFWVYGLAAMFAGCAGGVLLYEGQDQKK
jgi:hypothetical protein